MEMVQTQVEAMTTESMESNVKPLTNGAALKTNPNEVTDLELVWHQSGKANENLYNFSAVLVGKGGVQYSYDTQLDSKGLTYFMEKITKEGLKGIKGIKNHRVGLQAIYWPTPTPVDAEPVKN